MLATFPLMYKESIPDSNVMFNIVFLIVLTSVVFQGKTLMPFAKVLGLDKPLKVSPRVPLEFENTGTLDGEMKEFEVMESAPFIGKHLSELGLPPGALVLLIRRGHQFVVPRGNTKILLHDSLMVLGEGNLLHDVEKILGKSSDDEE